MYDNHKKKGIVGNFIKPQELNQNLFSQHTT